MYNQLNDDLLIEYLQVQYAHIINGVDLRFDNTLNSDSQMRLRVRLANIIIYNSVFETPWADIRLCGVVNMTMIGNREVVDCDCSLIVFSQVMRSRQLSFDYDHAIAFMK